MTLEKALDILTGKIEYTISEFNQAVRLGIEALKRLKKCRQAGYKFYCQLMPGETEK